MELARTGEPAVWTLIKATSCRLVTGVANRVDAEQPGPITPTTRLVSVSADTTASAAFVVMSHPPSQSQLVVSQEGGVAVDVFCARLAAVNSCGPSDLVSQATP